MELDWLPDWSGAACAILACGPSLDQREVDLLNGRVKIIAINRAYELAPFADVLYGCDRRFWNHNYKEENFGNGLLVSQTHAGEPLREGVELKYFDIVLGDKMIFDEKKIGSGANGGFQSINAAYHFKAKKIILLGFDMKWSEKLHFHGKHEPPLNNPSKNIFGRWKNGIESNSKELSNRGVEVLNCCLDSGLDCFEKIKLTDALRKFDV